MVDKDEVMEDWVDDTDESIDNALLNDGNSNSPHIPDAHPSDSDWLHSILLSSYCSCPILTDDYDSMPSLQTVSDSSIDGDEHFSNNTSMPSLVAGSVGSISEDEDLSDLQSETSLVAVSDSSIEEDVDWYMPVDDDEHICMSFAGAAVAGTEASHKMESDLYDSGASRHMTPFCH